MHLVPTGRGPERVEIYENRRCTGCQGLLVSPHVLIAHRPCCCVPGGHRTITCRDCGTVHYDPPHDQRITGIGADSYFQG